MSESQQVASAETDETKVNKDVTLTFRTQNKDSTKADKPEWKREAFKMSVPMPTIPGIMAICATGTDKEKKLLLDTMEALTTDVLRSKVNDAIDGDDPFTGTDGKVTSKVQLEAGMFDAAGLTLQAIALIPKGERGVGIAKEVIDVFIKDYSATMSTTEGTAALGLPYTKERQATHEAVIGSRLNKIRTKPDLLKQFAGFLDVWAAHSKNVDDNVQAFDFLSSRANTLLQTEVIDAL